MDGNMLEVVNKKIEDLGDGVINEGSSFFISKNGFPIWDNTSISVVQMGMDSGMITSLMG